MRRVSLAEANRFFGRTSIANRVRAALMALAHPEIVQVSRPARGSETASSIRIRAGATERLTGGVAHDINNLLQAVSGSLELLGDSVEHDPEATELVRSIAGSAGRSAQLIHQLQLFCRQQLTPPAHTDLHALMERLSDLLPRTLGSQAQVTFRLDMDLPTSLAIPGTDAGQIELCLLNVALDLFDAMPGGGALAVEARRRSIAAGCHADMPAGDYILVSIADVRGTGARDLTGDGLGLGLSIAAEIASASGAALRVGSETEGGSHVELWLPLLPIRTRAPAVGDAAGAATQRRVLLVDDAPDVLITLAAFLEGEGFAVVTARNGRDALAALKTNTRFDVVVTDYSMPGMSGSELLARIGAIAPDLPALVVTGFATVENLAVLHDKVEILRKPFRRDYLVRRVRALAQQTPGAPPQREPRRDGGRMEKWEMAARPAIERGCIAAKMPMPAGSGEAGGPD